MADQSPTFPSQFQEGSSPLHQLDPRLKLVVCLLLVMAVFAATSWGRFGITVLAAAALVWSGQGFNARLYRAIVRFRWFFIVSLLLHLLLSPGHTLFGLAWLSRDGLLTGLLVCGQMVVAIGSATLLAQTTSPELLARACGWFMTPLGWLGCRVHEWEEILLLSLNFLPVLHEEVVATASVGRAAPPHESATRGIGQWLSQWCKHLTDALERLVLRADAMAREIVEGDVAPAAPASLGPLFTLDFYTLLYIAGGVGFTSLYGLAGTL